jgi:hypothetical protein
VRTGQEIRQRGTFDQFEHERLDTIGLFEPMDRGDVGVIQGRERLGFALEPRDAVGVSREVLGQDLQRNVAIELRIARAIDHAHPALAEWRKDFIGADPGANRDCHVRSNHKSRV